VPNLLAEHQLVTVCPYIANLSKAWDVAEIKTADRIVTIVTCTKQGGKGNKKSLPRRALHEFGVLLFASFSCTAQ
jgi:hypothetical protein